MRDSSGIVDFFLGLLVGSIFMGLLALNLSVKSSEKPVPATSVIHSISPDPINEMVESFHWLPADSLKNHPSEMCGRVISALDALTQTMEQRVDFFSPRDSVLPGDVDTYRATVEFLAQNCGHVAGKWTVENPNSKLYRSARFEAALH